MPSTAMTTQFPFASRQVSLASVESCGPQAELFFRCQTSRQRFFGNRLRAWSAMIGLMVSGGLFSAAPVWAEEVPSPVSFRYEVIPVLTRLGCSQGTCHGTPVGKNGFRLSLRGFDPQFDWASVTRESEGRRVNRLQPEQSLLLLKSLNQSPHGGGRRLEEASQEYALLKNWVAQGSLFDQPEAPALVNLEIQNAPTVVEAPVAQVPLTVSAHFADGTVRPVTHLCRWSSSDEATATVDPAGVVHKQQRGEVTITAEYCGQFASQTLQFREQVPEFRWPDLPSKNIVDELVFQKLKDLQIEPSPVASDGQFLRRVSLDVTGRLPSTEEIQLFLAETSPHKREQAIDRLLDSPAFADWWAMKWTDRLGGNQRFTGHFGALKYHAWIRAAMAENRPEDQFVREILTATGANYEYPAASFWRRMRVGAIGTNVDAQLAAEEVTQLFLGVRIQCARCHNHPGERWRQEDFHGLAAFFSRIKFKQGSYFNHTYDKEEAVYLTDAGEARHPRTGQVIPPTFLDGVVPEISAREDRRVVFANWLTSPENPWFARNSVNRLWYHVFGKGIIDPVDDVRDSNPPSHPELLDELTRQFIASGFDRKHVLRLILNSQTYQLDSVTTPTNAADQRYFSHAEIRLLPAEVLLDAISDVTALPESFPGLPAGLRAVQLPDGEYKHPFLVAFGRPARAVACECEREADSNFLQALQLVSGESVARKVSHDQSRIAQLANSEKTNDQIVEDLFLATLSRPPHPAERELVMAQLSEAGPNRRRAVEDLLWILINHREFLFQH